MSDAAPPEPDESQEAPQEADSGARAEKTARGSSRPKNARRRAVRGPVESPMDTIDVFAGVYGHEGAKLVLRNALRNGDTHVRIVGPPGSGKSMLLEALETNVPGVQYWGCKSLKASKLQDILSENPPILLLDEFDRADPAVYDVLEMPMESGRVQKASVRETYDVEIDTQIIASMNPTDRLPPKIESRFAEPIILEKYSEEKYYKVCEHMLVKEIEWIETPAQAREVAKLARQFSDTTDPRSARNIARLADGFHEVDKVARALHDPDAEVGGVSLSPIEIAQTREHVERERLTQIAVADANDALAYRFPDRDPDAETPSDVKREIEEAVEEEVVKEVEGG